jgi:lipoprotein-anchoring transpeptidase ErfK/SrfK
MRKVILLCLAMVFFTSAANARLFDQELFRKLSLVDLLEIKSSRHSEGHSYSHFPGSERKLRLFSYSHLDPLGNIYAQAQTRMYTIQPNDTLKKIARRNGTTIERIKGVNRIKNDQLRAGRRLRIPDQVFTIEINKTFNRLYLKASGVVIKEYPVSTGKSAKQTPAGVFLIQSRYPYPTWFHKGVVVSAASADNYLGSRWLGFDKPQFGIHGTTFPELIGQSASKGCIRMRNEDVEELYEIIPVGTVVVITE